MRFSSFFHVGQTAPHAQNNHLWQWLVNWVSIPQTRRDEVEPLGGVVAFLLCADGFCISSISVGVTVDEQATGSV